ncbi:hypothetical protein IC762_23395 [Bradyrhizobium genosp. L]|nr:hypothetical protein [Bradyrhizobium genosp. L]QPF82677.1 hypothetical protein IC762_23395 [Bradyrhizobium genosp. L]
MTTTLVWSGIALWLGLNAAFVARRFYVTRSERAAKARVIYIQPRRA